MEELSKFTEILDYLMFENNLNKKTLAANVNIRATAFTNYFHHRHMPTVEVLLKIADYFNCSTDFLLGFEEENKNLTFKECPAFPEQLKFLIEYFKFHSAHAFYTSANIPKSVYYNWISGSKKPSLDNIIKLAEHFDRRVDFILGRET